MKLLYFILLIGIVSVLSAQTITPANIPGVKRWYFTSADGNNYISGLEGYSPLLAINNAKSNSGLINYRKAIVIAGNGYTVPFSTGNLNSFSLFIVYQPLDTSSEKIIWHLSKAGKALIVATTDRTADLETNNYMSYKDIVRSAPKLGVYQQQKNVSATSWGNTLYIGKKPAFPLLPLHDFNGLVPEFVLYDKVLTNEDRIKLSSYFSIKYGITLAEPVGTYLNSRTEVIWDGTSYDSYHHNIAGLIRDDSSGLNQLIATSSAEPDLFTVTTKNLDHNYSSLIWGNNANSFTEPEPMSLQRRILNKRWRIQPFNWQQQARVNFHVDTKKIDAPIQPKELIWLALDSSGNGVFSFERTAFFKMNELTQERQAIFKDIIVPEKHFHVGFFIEENFFLTGNTANASCSNNTKGNLSLKAVGAVFPVSLTITNIVQQSTYNDTIVSSDVFTTELGVGSYRLFAEDAQGNSYSDSFYINHADIPSPVHLLSNYALKNKQPLVIDAGQNMPSEMQYVWTGPDNFYSNSPSVTILAPGYYTLSTSVNGCSNYKGVLVTIEKQNPFKSILLYPNPSSGKYAVELELAKPMDMQMFVYTTEGRLLQKELFKGMSHYRYNGNLSVAGSYILVFEGDGFKESRKLIISRY